MYLRIDQLPALTSREGRERLKQLLLLREFYDHQQTRSIADTLDWVVRAAAEHEYQEEAADG